MDTDGIISFEGDDIIGADGCICWDDGEIGGADGGGTVGGIGITIFDSMTPSSS